MALWRGVRGHILKCGKTATNTCIIVLRLSLAKPGNSASVIISERSRYRWRILLSGRALLILLCTIVTIITARTHMSKRKLQNQLHKPG